MADDSHPQIVIACEADSDARVAKGFAERIMLEKIDWFGDLAEDARPSWGGVLPNSGYLRWASIAEEYKAARLPPIFGLRIDGNPPKLDAIATLKALRLAERLKPVATVLMRDLDSYPERREGLAQGRDEYKRKTPGISSMAVVLGTPDRYRETWLLAGFEAKHDREEKQLEKIRAELVSVDPIKESYRLRGADGEPRCAKDIWARLSKNDHTREVSCWEDTPIDILHSRGAAPTNHGCGLSAFLKEIEDQLVPAFQ